MPKARRSGLADGGGDGHVAGMSETMDIAAAWALLAAIFGAGFYLCYRLSGRDKWGGLIMFGGAVAFSAGLALFRG